MLDYVNEINFFCLLRVYMDNSSSTGICVHQTQVKCYIRKVYLGGIHPAGTYPSAFLVPFFGLLHIKEDLQN